MLAYWINQFSGDSVGAASLLMVFFSVLLQFIRSFDSVIAARTVTVWVVCKCFKTKFWSKFLFWVAETLISVTDKEGSEEVSCGRTMEVLGKSVIAEPSNVIFLSTILNTEGQIPSHKCDKRCQNEHIFGNMYRCKLTGMTHICDKNCNQRILYDNHNSLCRVSGQLFPLSPLELQAVRGIRRKHEVDSHEGCSFKRRRGAQLHPSPFERSYSAVSPIPSQAGDGMDLS